VKLGWTSKSSAKAARDVLVSIVVFSAVARLGLFFAYRAASFSELSWLDVVKAVLTAVRFDLSVNLTFVGLPLLLLCAPWPSRVSLMATRFLRLYCVLWGWIYGLVVVGDIVYFPYAKRHLFDELLLLGSDLGFFFKTAGTTFLLPVLILMVAMYLVVRGMRRIIPDVLQPIRGGWWTIVLLLFVSVVVVRGKLDGKPLQIADAYANGGAQYGDLILNGAFTSWHAMRNSSGPTPEFMSDEEAREALKWCGINGNEEYPLLQTTSPDSKRVRRNVVFILLESWFNKYIDSFSGGNMGLTPNFDALAQKSKRFTNFYANGSRSIEGIQAIVTGIPSMKGVPDLGTGLELNRLGSVANAAAANQFYSIFVQSSLRSSFRMDASAMRLGFERYLGAEDIPLQLKYDDKQSSIFGYDFETLQVFADELTAAPKPMFGFVFTGTTHMPYIVPPVAKFAEGHGSDNEIGFMNTIFYADWSLGEFFKKAEQQPWFKETIFVLTGDHTFPRFGEYKYLEKHRVPLLVYDPQNQVGIEDDVVGSHHDLLPTIADLAGWSGSLATVGHSLMQASDERRCAFVAGRFGNPAIITKEGYLVHSLERVVESSYGADCPNCEEQAARALLAFQQIVSKTVRGNRIVP
jgi:phosphoglycerol transferase MdoB-like AlkP superfamily enzyme